MDVLVREMTEGDIDAVATLRVRGWQTAYAGLMPRSYLDAMSAREDADRRREFFARGVGDVINLVAEEPAPGGGASGPTEVVGWACCGPCRDADLPSGDAELYALYVTPERHGTGIGYALLTESLRRLTEREFPRVRLWVVRGNERAERFYDRTGFTPDGGEESYEVAGVQVPERRYARDLPPTTPPATPSPTRAT
ncbi:GNAT family N-acetyltransferase [Streptomyces sp. NPDC057702]|uniref:GNAT family N-acetyltransferase n=1 Tax=unclassified Streptomyces TaxID=2593676 RepID=UPI0036C472D4